MAFYVYYGQETWVELFDPTNTWQEDVEAEGPRGRLSHGHPRQLSLTFSSAIEAILSHTYPFPSTIMLHGLGTKVRAVWFSMESILRSRRDFL
jgi:hypothetical protein